MGYVSPQPESKVSGDKNYIFPIMQLLTVEMLDSSNRDSWVQVSIRIHLILTILIFGAFVHINIYACLKTVEIL